MGKRKASQQEREKAREMHHGEGITEGEKQRIKLLQRALSQKPVNIAVILTEAHYRGLPDALRGRCWRAILNVQDSDLIEPTRGAEHRDEMIVSKDVARSMWAWGEKEHSKKERTQYRDQLSTIINSVLSRNPENYYYQGYHDVATVLIMCSSGIVESHTMLERLSRSYFREAMQPTVEPVIQELRLLLVIVSKEHRKLTRFFHRGLPDTECFFAVPWVLTWFAHSINDPSELLRLYDFFLSSHPLMPIYFSAALILRNANEILQLPCDMSSILESINKMYSKITHETIDSYLYYARKLFHKHRPYDLLSGKESDLPKDSCLLDFPYPWMSEAHCEWMVTHNQTNSRHTTLLTTTAPYLIAGVALAGGALYMMSMYNRGK